VENKKADFSISYFYKRSGNVCVYLISSYRQNPVKFSTAAYVPCCVMQTTRERVIWQSGPGYTTRYKVQLSKATKKEETKSTGI
jgi:hypothetical protein